MKTELTIRDLEQLDNLDNAILNMINEVRPEGSNELDYNDHDLADVVGSIKDILCDLFVKDLNLCTEQEFYPFIEDTSDQKPRELGDCPKLDLLDELTTEFKSFCDNNGLPHMSADDLARGSEVLAIWQYKYISNFIERWDAATREYISNLNPSKS